jgi:hypothetical protein
LCERHVRTCKRTFKREASSQKTPTRVPVRITLLQRHVLDEPWVALDAAGPRPYPREALLPSSLTRNSQHLVTGRFNSPRHPPKLANRCRKTAASLPPPLILFLCLSLSLSLLISDLQQQQQQHAGPSTLKIFTPPHESQGLIQPPKSVTPSRMVPLRPDQPDSIAPIRSFLPLFPIFWCLWFVASTHPPDTDPNFKDLRKRE